MKIIAYVLAGSVLVLIAQFAPKFALATAGLIGLWAVLEHYDQLNALSSFITKNAR